MKPLRPMRAAVAAAGRGARSGDVVTADAADERPSTLAPARRLGALLAGVFVIGFSLLLQEIALTRVVSVLMWHHFAHVVIALGLLGLGAAGSLLTVRRQGSRGPPSAGSLAAWSSAYGVASLAALLLLARQPFSDVPVWRDAGAFLDLLRVHALVALPFFCAGMVLGLVLSGHARDVGRVYCADLVGSALGAASSSWLIGRLGAPAVVTVACACGFLAALLFGLRGSRLTRVLAGLGLALAAWVALASSGGVGALRVPALDWVIPCAADKAMARYDPAELERHASPVAEIEVGPERVEEPVMGGDLGALDRVAVPLRWVFQDGGAPTLLFRGAADLARFPFLDDFQTASGWVAWNALRRATPPHALVIGVGGGIDVQIALAHGAREITAIDVNPAMISLLERSEDYLGGLFRSGPDHPIRLVTADGRSFVRATGERYDLIQLSGVDSFAALNGVALTLAESHLYTLEAVRELYGRLADGGILHYSRGVSTWPRRERETLRLAVTAREALASLGVARPEESIAVLQGRRWASTLIKRGGFVPAEIEALATFARRERFAGLLFDPLASPDRAPEPSADWLIAEWDELEELLLRRYPAADAAALLADLGDGVVRLALGREDAAGLLARLARDHELGPDADRLSRAIDKALPRARAVLEHARETRASFTAALRGTELERARFLAAYPLEIRPATDDRPFFFNAYRLSDVLAGALGPDEDPAAHYVLGIALLQLALLAVLLLVAPLLPRGRAALRAAGAWRACAYFAALGLGFMLVELGLMQRLVVFLGHPAHALTVVLAALLFFAGLGALAASRWSLATCASPGRVAVLVAMAVLANLAEVRWLLPELMSASFGWRVAAAVLVLAPTGLILGTAFPAGIRLLAQRAPELVPWAWAVNGFMSVVGSVLCALLALELGFTRVLLLGVAVYLLGFAALRSLVRS